MRQEPRQSPGACRLPMWGSVFHASHSATGHGRCRRVLLRQLGKHCFGRDEQASNRGCILQRRTDHLGRIDKLRNFMVASKSRLRVRVYECRVGGRELPLRRAYIGASIAGQEHSSNASDSASWGPASQCRTATCYPPSSAMGTPEPGTNFCAQALPRAEQSRQPSMLSGAQIG